MTLTNKNYSSNWVEVKLKEILLPFQTLDPQNTPENTFTYIDIGSINNRLHIIEEPKTFLGKDAPSRARRIVQKGDVLFSTVRPYLKNICSVPDNFDNCLTSTGICILRPSQNLDPKFLFWSVIRDNFVKQISGDMDGTLYPAVRDNDIYETFISVPPLPEQRRIVAKIDALFERSRRARQFLEAIPPLLEKFRQSVLAAAFRGDLTKEWREKNKTVEPASVLLERIRAERRKRWEEAELAKLRAKGREPLNNDWKAKYVEPEPVDTSDLPELPEGWAWASLEHIGDAIDPQPSHRTPPEVLDGIPYVSIGDINDDDSINFDKARKVSPKVLEEHKERYTLKDGDIVFGKIGTLGKPIKLTQPFNYTLSANVILIQTKSEYLFNDWLFFFLKSPFIENLLDAQSNATSQAAFGIKKARILPIPIPPINEQKEIIKKVANCIDSSNKQQTWVAQSLQRINSLDQSILAKAFRGELVPQDPNDEPASVLLERIKAERATNEEAKNGKKVKSKQVAKQEAQPQQSNIMNVEQPSTTNTATKKDDEGGRDMVQMPLFE